MALFDVYIVYTDSLVLHERPERTPLEVKRALSEATPDLGIFYEVTKEGDHKEAYRLRGGKWYPGRGFDYAPGDWCRDEPWSLQKAGRGLRKVTKERTFADLIKRAK